MIEYDKATCDNMKDKIVDKVKIIDIKIKELSEIKTLLVNGVSNCETGCCSNKANENCSILIID